MILQELATDKRIIDACKRIGQQYHQDLYQELFVILCEAPTEKLEAMKKSGYLHYWIIRTLCNMITPTGDRKSTRLNSSHSQQSRMPSSA